MHYEVVESSDYPGHWHVEAIDADGRVSLAVFWGRNAAERAHGYASWKNSVLAPAERAQMAAAV